MQRTPSAGRRLIAAFKHAQMYGTHFRNPPARPSISVQAWCQKISDATPSERLKLFAAANLGAITVSDS